MRVGIISDTHDRRKRTARAIAKLRDKGAEVFFHCGDLTGPEIVTEFAGNLTYFVFGNNDYNEDVLRVTIEAIDGVCLGYSGLVELEGKRIAITHGDYLRELRKLAAANPDYLFYGHSHIADDERHGPTRWINPGALHRAARHTVALLNLKSDSLKFLEIR